MHKSSIGRTEQKQQQHQNNGPPEPASAQ